MLSTVSPRAVCCILIQICSPFSFFSRSFEDFEILHGDMQGLTDTMSFLKSLSGLVGNDLRSPEKQTRERAAASVLFDWEVLSSLYNPGA
jgi:hypothetical protein